MPSEAKVLYMLHSFSGLNSKFPKASVKLGLLTSISKSNIVK